MRAVDVGLLDRETPKVTGNRFIGNAPVSNKE